MILMTSTFCGQHWFCSSVDFHRLCRCVVTNDITRHMVWDSFGGCHLMRYRVVCCHIVIYLLAAHMVIYFFTRHMVVHSFTAKVVRHRITRHMMGQRFRFHMNLHRGAFNIYSKRFTFHLINNFVHTSRCRRAAKSPA